MIERGEKLEEYREVKNYWVNRLVMTDRDHPLNRDVEWHRWESYRFSRVKFRYGYTKRTMTFECKGIVIGYGRREWGAPEGPAFIIRLGKRLK